MRSHYRAWVVAFTGPLWVLAGCVGGEPTAPPGDPVEEPTPTATRPQVGAWSALADLPQARGELSAAALDGTIYAGTGFARTAPGEAFFRYETVSDTWQELAPLPETRHHAPLAAHAGKVYVVAGFSTTAHENHLFGSPTDTLFVYGVASDTWQLGPRLPQVVAAHAVATTDQGLIHVLGGVGEQALPARDDHLVLDPATGEWSRLPPMPSGREHLGAAYLNGVIYAAAGRNGGDGVAFEAYHVERREWTVLPEVPTARSGVAVVAFQEQIYVLGGELGEATTGRGTHDVVERFDPRTGIWQEMTRCRMPGTGSAG
jgi:N-acetylneuraminic acid mutarotase